MLLLVMAKETSQDPELVAQHISCVQEQQAASAGMPFSRPTTGRAKTPLTPKTPRPPKTPGRTYRRAYAHLCPPALSAWMPPAWMLMPAMEELPFTALGIALVVRL